MMNRILVAFALKEEFAPWRSRHRFHPFSVSQRRVLVASFGTTEVYVSLVGAGAPDAYVFDDLMAQFTPSLGIATGVAAGLKPEWQPGDLLVAQSVLGPDGEEKILADQALIELAVQCGAKPAALLTVPHVVRTTVEKARLASLGDAADMESLPLLKRWSARGIPSLALRVILDPAEAPMNCDFEATLDAHGQVRTLQILAQLARRPQLLPGFLSLAFQSRRVLSVLARFLDRYVELLDRKFLGLKREGGEFRPLPDNGR